MKKFLVIGNPIDHSLSPKLHNYWIKKNKINAVYEKQKLDDKDLGNLIIQVKEKNISGLNVTVPFKKLIIPFLDRLSDEAQKTQSVNMVYLDNNKVIGHNTDIGGFEMSIQRSNIDLSNKKVLILGAGGVVPSIIYALIKMHVKKITISNRTKKKAEHLKTFFKDIEIIDWGKLIDFDMIINATSIGLKKEDKIKLDFVLIGTNKYFFDVIYNPKETDFLRNGKKLGHTIINGQFMFIYQALSAFNIWHNVKPDINDEVTKLLDVC
jgi:shikimate dehydrogenase